ncbi:UNVERIFIED_CONTAM: hypothetical protein NCL1_40241 [Trichonephila clavipes]
MAAQASSTVVPVATVATGVTNSSRLDSEDDVNFIEATHSFIYRLLLVLRTERLGDGLQNTTHGVRTFLAPVNIKAQSIKCDIAPLLLFDGIVTKTHRTTVGRDDPRSNLIYQVYYGIYLGCILLFQDIILLPILASRAYSEWPSKSKHSLLYEESKATGRGTKLLFWPKG